MRDVTDIQRIFLSLRSSLARSVFGIVPPAEIEDIVQETYVRVCQVEKKEKIRAPRSFMYKTARNIALDYAKRSETRLTDRWGDDDYPQLHGVEWQRDETFEQVAADAEFSQFCEAVRLLPLQCRRVFVLKKVYGYSQREISRELSLSESTVEKHIAKGIKRCSNFILQQNLSNTPEESLDRRIHKMTSSHGGDA